jgi:hypothetical protein
VLFLNQEPRNEGVPREWRYNSTHSLTSALDGGKWWASRPGPFTLRERAPGTHWIGGWVGSRAGLGAVVKRKIPSPCRESNPWSSSAMPLRYPGSSCARVNNAYFNMWNGRHLKVGEGRTALEEYSTVHNSYDNVPHDILNSALNRIYNWHHLTLSYPVLGTGTNELHGAESFLRS